MTINRVFIKLSIRFAALQSRCRNQISLVYTRKFVCSLKSEQRAVESHYVQKYRKMMQEPIVSRFKYKIQIFWTLAEINSPIRKSWYYYRRSNTHYTRKTPDEEVNHEGSKKLIIFYKPASDNQLVILSACRLGQRWRAPFWVYIDVDQLDPQGCLMEIFV